MVPWGKEMPYDLSNQCLFVINEQCTNNTTSQSYSYQLIHEEIQMPKLFWTSMSSTHISLPPTSCLVKSFKLSSVLTMAIYIYLEVYRCIAKYRKESLGKKKKKSMYWWGDLRLPLAVSGNSKQSHRERRPPTNANRKTRDPLSFLCLLGLLGIYQHH